MKRFYKEFANTARQFKKSLIFDSQKESFINLIGDDIDNISDEEIWERVIKSDNKYTIVSYRLIRDTLDKIVGKSDFEFQEIFLDDIAEWIDEELCNEDEYNIEEHLKIILSDEIKRLSYVESLLISKEYKDSLQSWADKYNRDKYNLINILSAAYETIISEVAFKGFGIML